MFVWIYRDKRIIHSLENISLCFLKFMLISSITCCIQATVHRLQGLHPGSPPNTASSFLTPPHVWSAPQVLILQLQSAKKSSCTGPSFLEALILHLYLMHSTPLSPQKVVLESTLISWQRCEGIQVQQQKNTFCLCHICLRLFLSVAKKQLGRCVKCTSK